MIVSSQRDATTASHAPSGERVPAVLMLFFLLLLSLVRPLGAPQALSAPLLRGGVPGDATAVPLAGPASPAHYTGPSAGPRLSALETTTITFQEGASPTAAYIGVADTYLNSYYVTASFGGTADLKMAYDDRYRILLRFDIAGDIPRHATVTAAKLELYAYYYETPAVSTDIALYKVLRPWTEDGASWQNSADDQLWDEAGCEGAMDRSQELIDEAKLRTTNPWTAWESTLFTGLVQRWVADPERNYGMILLSRVPNQPRQFWNLYSSQTLERDVLSRPKLTVSYSVPVPTVTPTITPTPTQTPVPSITPTRTQTPLPTEVITTAMVAGVAWRDQNANLQRDPGELPIADVTVILRDPGHLEVGRRTTLGDGSYRFDDIAEGSYLLDKENPPGHVSTWPPGGVYAFYLAGGQAMTGLDFGFSLLPTYTLTITPTRTLTPVATLTRTPTRTTAATITLTPQGTATPTFTPTRTTTLTPTPTLTPKGTPAGTLQDPIPVLCEETHSESTATHASVITSYGNCGAGMWGPEVIYSFQSGYALERLSISLDTGADLALFVLSSANPMSCFRTGGAVVIEGVAAGVTYYIAVDGSESGTYTMEVQCDPPPMGTPTRTRTATTTPTQGPSRTPTPTATPSGLSQIYLPILSKPRIEFLVDCGSSSVYIDGSARLWAADKAYSAGSWGFVGDSDVWAVGRDIVVSIPGTMRLYQSVRYGYAFGYQFNLPNGVYDVELHFAEIFHDQVGERVFDVIIEGQTVLDQFDIFEAAGGRFRSDIETFAISVSDGQLDMVFDSVVDLAMVNAIKVSE